MQTAFLLINCNLGSEEDAIKQLEDIDGIKDVQLTYGEYDILAKVEMETAESLRSIITERIRRITKIRSVITLMCVADQENPIP